MHDSDCGLLKCFPEAFLAIKVRNLHPLALGDVFDEAFEIAGSSIGPANLSTAHGNPDDGAIFSLVLALEPQNGPMFLEQAYVPYAFIRVDPYFVCRVSN